MSDRETSPALNTLLDPGVRHRDRLGKICRAALEVQGIETRHLSNSDCQSEIVDPRHGARTKAFFGAVLLRLLAIDPTCLREAQPEFRVAAMKLFQHMPQIFSVLGVDPSLQGHQKLAALERAAPEAERYLSDAFKPIDGMGTFEQGRQRVMRAYSNQLVRALLLPFIHAERDKGSLNAVLRAVDEYRSADPRTALEKYGDAEAALVAALGNESSADRLEREVFRPFLESVLNELRAHFRSSPASLGAAIIMRPSGRKYPFAEVGAPVRLRFALENLGAGVGLDVHVAVEVDGALIGQVSSQFLDRVDPDETVEPVEFQAQVAEPATAGVAVLCRLTWKNGDGSSGEWEDLFTLESQPAGIEWEQLQFQEPYSLEPVRRFDELVGRTEQIRHLLAKLRAPSIGSFWIHGQRRVGKTSVVATLSDVPAASDLTIVYIETGEFIDPEPKITVNNLGRKICSRLISSDPRFDGLSTPHFDGALSPLDDFLSGALRRIPELRLVLVLDEFDALPDDLYRRGGAASHAFFMTIRSLSGKEAVGFILVGGEKMPEILSTQGETLNKFRPLRIDYLDRESQWADFVELVRRPVQAWATISDDAVSGLYDETAGNPFFTKFVCAVLASDMIGRRDAFAGAPDMRRAVDVAVRVAGINNFQHFWDDGIVASSPDRAEKERAARRRILVTLAKCLRKDLRTDLAALCEGAQHHGVPESETERVLSDFEKRRVLVHDDGRYRCKVRLFERWLVDRGLNEIALTLAEEDALRAQIEAEEELRVKDHEMVTLADRWGSYRGVMISDQRVRAWLDQFDRLEEQRWMFNLLKGIRFYSGGLLREKLREGHGFVVRELAARGVARVETPRARKRTDNILISYFGGEGKRGGAYAKLYADENSIYHERVVAPEKLVERLTTLEDVEGVVFVDDFIGTGRTVSAQLVPIVERLAKDLNAGGVDLFLVAVAGFGGPAEGIRRKLEALVPRSHVSVVDRLDESDRCFSTESTTFPDSGQRTAARQVATEYGRKLVKTHPLGHDGSEALVVFEMTCPNNSLPILWADGAAGNWTALFPRP